MTAVAAVVPPAAAAPRPARGAIRIDHVSKAYRANGPGLRAVDDCSLDIAAGEFCVLVGPSGCGKTTLLNAVAGFHGIDAGTISLDGRILCGPGQPQAEIGPDRTVVFQNGALFPWKTNLENVAFGPIVQGTLSRREALEKARDLLAEAGLRGQEDAYPGQTSSGVRRRVEIVRALINDPAVLLLDEPFRALDSLTKSVMHETLLETYARRRITVLFITHDLEEAVFLGTRVVVMTTRPARPKTILEVDIPYPRRHDLLTSDRYRALVQEATAAVHDEARKAFELGEAEGRA
ncbi:MAG TPA: ABC transporter ATP-binding protein [Polyangia bacterium]|nr:ABC transporter ATP-binding protein [Polyangia bacterium]